MMCAVQRNLSSKFNLHLCKTVHETRLSIANPSPGWGESDDEAPQPGQWQGCSQTIMLKSFRHIAHTVQCPMALVGAMMIQPIKSNVIEARIIAPLMIGPRKMCAAPQKFAPALATSAPRRYATIKYLASMTVFLIGKLLACAGATMRFEWFGKAHSDRNPMLLDERTKAATTRFADIIACSELAVKWLAWQ